MAGQATGPMESIFLRRRARYTFEAPERPSPREGRLGPAAGAVVVGMEIWPFAKFESGPAGHSEDRADPRALNAYTASQSTSPAVSARGLR